MTKKPFLAALILAIALYPIKSSISKADIGPGLNQAASSGTALGISINRNLTSTNAMSTSGLQPVSTVKTVDTILSAAFKTKKVWVTAFSSSPDETDDTPFVTASGKYVRDGIIASNFLPFGTKVKIPALFGDKVFIVEDRMAESKTNVVDVWMPSKAKALRFGVSRADLMILE